MKMRRTLTNQQFSSSTYDEREAGRLQMGESVFVGWGGELGGDWHLHLGPWAVGRRRGGRDEEEARSIQMRQQHAQQHALSTERTAPPHRTNHGSSTSQSQPLTVT
mmetsp:Transcript_5862/g.17115  ORF Transcript_5862/g.17115 Transcript_5862/m.17115 type:complete len:106 (-) Transcript_5862:45-362(-)